MTAEQEHTTPGHGGAPTPGTGEDELHPLLRKLVNNIKTIAIVFGALVVIFGGYALYDYVQTKRLTSSSEMLGEVLITTSGEERVKALQEFLGRAPAALEPAVLLELAAALQETQNYEGALDVWNQLDGVDDPALHPVVQLGKAEALAQSGQQEAALELLSGWKASAPRGYKAVIEQRIAEVAEDAGKIDQALEAYRELEKSEQLGPSVKDFLRYKIARLEGEENG